MMVSGVAREKKLAMRTGRRRMGADMNKRLGESDGIAGRDDGDGGWDDIRQTAPGGDDKRPVGSERLEDHKRLAFGGVVRRQAKAVAGFKQRVFGRAVDETDMTHNRRLG